MYLFFCIDAFFIFSQILCVLREAMSSRNAIDELRWINVTVYDELISRYMDIPSQCFLMFRT